MKNTACLVLLFVCGLSIFASGAAPVGWSCFAGGGRVYRAKLGGSEEALTSDVSARHARWAVDGKLIFYILGNNEIWAMNNDGTDQRKIGTGNVPSGSPLAAYRPDPNCVLSVEGSRFYKVNAATQDKTLICDCGRNVYGEIAISSDGTRIVFRDGGSLYKIVVDPNNPSANSPSSYSGACSASISADGNWMTHNQDSHTQMDIYRWSGGVEKVLGSGVVGTWDNQSFAANSSDWICVLGDNGVGTNQGSECGVASRATGEVHMVCDWSGFDVNYPDFFVGELPPIGPVVTYELAVTVVGQGNVNPNGGTFNQGSSVDMLATAAAGWQFLQWGGDANGTNAQFSITMNSDKSVSATFAEIPPDDNPPSVPGNLAVTTVSNTSMGVSWNASTDDISGVKEYVVYINGTEDLRTSETHASLTGLTRDTEYTVEVSAVDNAGNESARCAPVAQRTTNNENTLFIAAKDGALQNGMTAVGKGDALAFEAVYGSSGSTSSPSSIHSVATYTVDIPTAGQWYAWGRFNFVEGANSFWIQIDDQPAITFGNTATYNTWLWDGNSSGAAVNLGTISAGQHVLRIYGREVSPECLLDFICLTADAGYTPSDNDARPDVPTRADRRGIENIALSQATITARSTAAGDLKLWFAFTGRYSIDLYSLNGERIAQESGNAPGTKVFNAQQLGASMYLMRITSGSRMYSERILVGK